MRVILKMPKAGDLTGDKLVVTVNAIQDDRRSNGQPPMPVDIGKPSVVALSRVAAARVAEGHEVAAGGRSYVIAG